MGGSGRGEEVGRGEVVGGDGCMCVLMCYVMCSGGGGAGVCECVGAGAGVVVWCCSVLSMGS